MFKDKKILIITIVIATLFFLFIIMEITGYILAGKNPQLWQDYVHGQNINDALLTQLSRRNLGLRKKIENSFPRRVYLVIDTAQNILYIKKGNQILKQAVVSCGSGNILEAPDGNRRWVFDTPRGEFHIQSKLKDPVWVKPDWAFIEEGKAIPKEQNERVEEGVLGDYALGFGDGYFVHGTLYTRMLGRNVTHGCIRVGDEDLKELFKRVSIGAKLIIF
jgi:L,D-transpeptidase YbiS